MRKLFIEIRKDDKFISLDEYKATMVGNKFIPKAPTIDYKQAKNNPRPIVSKNYTYNADETILQFKVSGVNHGETDFLVRKLMNDLIDFDFRISSQLYWRSFLLNSVSVEWKDYEKKCVVTLNGISFCWGFYNEINIADSEQMYYIDSPIPTPLTYEITALENVNNISINNFTIKSLRKDETIVIDSYYCKVTINGNNAIDRLEIYDFEYAKGVYKVVSNSLTNLKVKVKWRARL